MLSPTIAPAPERVDDPSRTTSPRRRGLPSLGGGLAPLAWLCLLLYGAFLIWPVTSGFLDSFTNKNPMGGSTKFVGLGNYRELLTDQDLKDSLKFTAICVVAVTSASNIFGLAFALLLNGTQTRYRLLRTLIFIPQVLSGVIVGFIWQIMFTQNGLINGSMSRLSLHEPVPWLGTPNLAAFSICVVASWATIAFCTVVYAASLQSVPQELYEAARMDGAGPLRRFWHVTWPMIAAGTTINVVLCLIGSLKMYDVVAVMTGGGPAGSTRTVAMYVIQQAFTNNRFGYGAAGAMLLLALVAVVGYGSTALLRKREVRL